MGIVRKKERCHGGGERSQPTKSGKVDRGNQMGDETSKDAGRKIAGNLLFLGGYLKRMVLVRSPHWPSHHIREKSFKTWWEKCILG